MADRLPWAKFSFDAWATDPGLVTCSKAAKGFWMDLLCFASKEGGYVKLGGAPPTVKQLAMMTRSEPAEVRAWLAELKAHNVFSVDENHFIFSRRMVRSFEESEKGKRDGKLGGNPTLLKTNKKTQLPKGGISQTKTQTKKREEKTPKPPGGAGLSDQVREAFDLWNVVAKRCDLPIAKNLSPGRRRAIEKRLKDGGGLDGWRAAIAGVEASAFCRGQVPGKTFRADLDFVCQAISFNRLVEGFYGNDAKGAVVEIENWSPWRTRMLRFRAGGYWEEVNWGPRPGEPGCEVPEEFLASAPRPEDLLQAVGLPR